MLYVFGLRFGKSWKTLENKTIVFPLPRSSDAPNLLPQLAPSGAPALSDGGAVPGSAAASAAPPPASRQSRLSPPPSAHRPANLRTHLPFPSRLSPVAALASVLRAPAGDPAYASPSPLPPLLYRGSPASYPVWPGLGSAGEANLLYKNLKQ
jgi:hypothetical protein